MADPKDPDLDHDDDRRGGRNPDRALDTPTALPPRHHGTAAEPIKPAPIKKGGPC